jgi:hypothetical protein
LATDFAGSSLALSGSFPDGLDDLAAPNFITFKSHRETLDDWAMKELVGHYVAYRKLVSPSPAELLAEDHFRLYAVCARFPQNLSGQVPWQERQAGVYDCKWGPDVVRVIVAGQLPREAHNAALHLLSASPELVGFGSGTYQRRSARTSLLLSQLFVREGFTMSYTMEDFTRDYMKEHFPELSPKDQEEVLQKLPPERLLKVLPVAERLAGLSEQQIRQYLDQMSAGSRQPRGKSRRKKK